jgi:hypothetical protein
MSKGELLADAIEAAATELNQGRTSLLNFKPHFTDVLRVAKKYRLKPKTLARLYAW